MKSCSLWKLQEADFDLDLTGFDMRHPAGGFLKLLAGCTARPLQQFQDGRGLAPVAGAAALGFRSGFLSATGAFLGRFGLLPALSLGGRNGRATFRTGGLFVGVGLVAGGGLRRGRGFFDPMCSFWVSLRGESAVMT